jgi:hypothetical protein
VAAEATPSCQLLPPGMPAYSRTAYTVNPQSDGAYHGPDSMPRRYSSPPLARSGHRSPCGA